MSEPYLGEIKIVGFNFAPRGWALCDHQLLPIAQNTALFSLFGTTFGGDGRTTFGLPGLRGRTAVHVGNGAGLNSIQWGQVGGVNTNTQAAGHSHSATLNGATGLATSTSPAGNVLGQGETIYEPNTQTVTPMGSKSVTVANAGSPGGVTNMQPFLGLYHVVALIGIFPSRS